MEKREQRFVIKFFFLKGLGSKKIHRKLQDTIGESAYCLAEVKFWLARFREGDLSCEDHERVGRPLAVLGTVLHKFLTKHPFASARIMAEHFNLSHPTVKEILQREMGLRKFTRRWVPHLLTPSQKAERVDAANRMLEVLELKRSDFFEGITTGDESWFRYSYCSDHMYAESAEAVVPRVRLSVATKKVMLTVFFTASRLIVLQELPKGSTFTRDFLYVQFSLRFLRKKEIYSKYTWCRLFHTHG